MAHMLARLRNVRVETVAEFLERDAEEHAKRGMRLEHLWWNSENPTEAVFLFRVDDLNSAREFIRQTHEEARMKDPNANLPQILFLVERNVSMVDGASKILDLE